MPLRKHSPSDLKAGILIQDIQTGDLALLIKRVDLFEFVEDEQPLWIWEITWTGPATDSYNRHMPFIEEAVLGLLDGGVWEIKGDDGH
tara:strand:- start:6776 stop:7039 length:264 start_codon:yes stop_codon:yes gene_type:complete